MSTPRQFLLRGPDEYGRVALTRVGEHSGFARAVFDGDGHLHYELKLEPSDWAEEVAALTNQMLLHRDHADHGFVRHLMSTASGWGSVVKAYPPRPPAERDARLLEACRVNDAYGVQLLTGEHLARTHDLSGWQVRQVSDRLHLVEAADPAAWFAQDEPTPEALEQARADFGDAILTTEEARADFLAREEQALALRALRRGS